MKKLFQKFLKPIIREALREELNILVFKVKFPSGQLCNAFEESVKAKKSSANALPEIELEIYVQLIR